MIDIDCIDQSVEVDDKFVSLIYFACFFFPISSIYIGRYFCSSLHPKMKTDFMETVNLLTIELQLRVEGSNNYHFLKKIFLKNLRNLVFSSKPGLKSSGCRYPAFHDLDLPPFRRRCSSGCSYILE